MVDVKVVDREIEGIKKTVKEQTGKEITDDAANQLRKELGEKK